MTVPTGTSYLRKTQFAFMATSLLSVPLLAAYNFIGVILYRDLGGSPFQLTVLTMLRPMVAILALYWSAAVAGRSDRLLKNLIWSGVLARVPFLFCPWVRDPWMLITIAAFYMLLSRGGIPAWMEVFRRNLPRASHGKIFSIGTAWGYVEGIVLGIGMGVVLDGQAQAWQWLFPLSAVVGLTGVFAQSRIPIKESEAPREIKKESLKRLIVDPWLKTIKLLRSRPDFRFFQWGFMICGAGIMILQPALPIFFVDVLGITYTELAIALTISKGLGFAVTSPMWARWWSGANVYLFSAAIFSFVALFPICLLMAPIHHAWLYIAYLVYGIGQAGSEMCWHLSGSKFCREGDSSLFTGVNVTMVGVRGAVVPALGSLICVAMGPISVLVAGMVLGLTSSVLMLRYRKMYRLSLS